MKKYQSHEDSEENTWRSLDDCVGNILSKVRVHGQDYSGPSELRSASVGPKRQVASNHRALKTAA